VDKETDDLVNILNDPVVEESSEED